MRKLLFLLGVLISFSTPLHAESMWDFLHRQSKNCTGQGGNWHGLSCNGQSSGRALTAAEKQALSNAVISFFSNLNQSQRDCILALHTTDAFHKVGLASQRFLENYGAPNDKIIVFQDPDGDFIITNDIITAKTRREISHAKSPYWKQDCYKIDFVKDRFTPVLAGSANIVVKNEPNNFHRIVDIEWLAGPDTKAQLNNYSFFYDDFMFPIDGEHQFKIGAKTSMLANLSKQQLLSQVELEAARNEIYARYGLIFKSQRLSQYFATKPWYVPRFNSSQITLNSRDRDFASSFVLFEKRAFTRECRLRTGSHNGCNLNHNSAQRAQFNRCLEEGQDFHICATQR